MQNTNYKTHQSFLGWLIGFSLLVFGLIACWQLGYLDRVLAGDKTGISLAILAAFVLVNGHVMLRAYMLSKERNLAVELSSLLANGKPVVLACSEGELRCCGERIEASFASAHLANLTRKLSIHAPETDQGGLQTHLLAALDRRVRSGQRYGWLIADLMIKLGLIGTVVGFVIMLGSVSLLENFDVSTMQQLLTHMTGGMQVALFTTLTGLVSGLLLGVQYHFLDGQADALITEIEEMSEIYALPALLGGTREQ